MYRQVSTTTPAQSKLQQLAPPSYSPARMEKRELTRICIDIVTRTKSIDKRLNVLTSKAKDSGEQIERLSRICSGDGNNDSNSTQ